MRDAPPASTDIARELLGRTVYPRLFRTLLGVEEPLKERPDEAAIAADLDLAPIREPSPRSCRPSRSARPSRSVVLNGLNQLDFYDLGSRNSPVPIIGERQPPAVGHVVVECRRRRELEKLDLKRPPVCTVAPRALQHLATVPGNQVQNPVFIGDEGIPGTRLRPEQNTKRQTHSRDPERGPGMDSFIGTECPIWNDAAIGRLGQLGRMPGRQEFCCSLAALGEALGVQGIPDGQVEPPELLADGELPGIDGIPVGGQDA